MIRRAEKQGQGRKRRVYFYPSGFAGMAFYAHKLCHALQKEGMEVTLFAYQNYELDHLPALFQKRKILSCGSLSFQYQQSHLRRILRILWAKSTNFFLFYRAARREKPPIVHIQELFYPLDWIFIYLFTKTPCKLILTVHDVLPHKFYTRHFTFFEIKIIGLIYHWVDTLIVHSETNRKQLLDRFRIPPQKAVVVPHGEYSLQEFLPPLPLTREEARKSLGLPGGNKVLLFFGHIRQDKGLDILLRAFQQVLSVDRKVLLIIAGLPMQGESFDPYERLIGQLNLQSKVFCFLEYIDLKDVPRYFISADIVCLPYIRFFSQSGVLHLAQGFGKPVIVSKVGGLSEVVQHGRSGLVVTPNSISHLREAILFLLKDQALCQQMGKEALKIAQKHFSWDKIARRTIRNVYVL